nr:reverse transcriptase domain-containing protein [Tanacetum cinerariifolium]
MCPKGGDCDTLGKSHIGCGLESNSLGDLPGSLHMRATKQSRKPAGKANNIVSLKCMSSILSMTGKGCEYNKMRTQSDGRPVAESRGRGTGERVGRGGRGKGPKGGNDERFDKVNSQGNDQGLRVNGGVEGVNGNVEGVNGGVGRAPDFSMIILQQLQNLLPAMLAQNVGNAIINGNRVGCPYKEFLACNPKEYDGKRGVVVLTRWIEKLVSMQDMSGRNINQKVKYTAGSFVGKALTWRNSQIRTLSQEVVVSMLWNDFKFMMIEEFCPSLEMQKLETELWNQAMVEAGHAAYTDRFRKLARLVLHLVTPESRKIERNGSIKKVEKKGDVGEPRKDKNVRDDNKRARTGKAFAFTTNPVGRENIAKDCRGVPRNVNIVNARNSIVRACYECGSIDHVRSACPRLNREQGQEETIQTKFLLIIRDRLVETKGTKLGDPNIVTGRFTLNNHFVTTLFDSGIEPSELGFRYEIEIASRQLVEIDKVIKGWKLEIEGHVFDIDLIPFGHGSFDMIIGMDWLSNHKAEIICREKVMRIPLLDGKVLKVLGKKPKEKMRQLKSAKAKEKEHEEIVVLSDFLK